MAKIVAETPDLKTFALSDKEFILANGKKEDADKLWAQLQGRHQDPRNRYRRDADTAI